MGADVVSTEGSEQGPEHDRLRFIRLLGEGGSGNVYEAIDLADGARIAIKVLRKADIGNLLRFKQEFRSVADLHHPNLVQLFELIQSANDWLITMELVDGSPLSAYLPAASPLETTLPWDGRSIEVDGARSTTNTRTVPPSYDADVVRSILIQVVDGLSFLHGHGIVHGDLKPANVLITSEGRARLVDFGLATQVVSASPVREGRSLSGTLPYMAPELLAGERPTVESDLFALGCLGFHLLTGQLPFGPAGIGPALALQQALPKIRGLVDGVPSDLIALCVDLLSPRAEARPGLVEVAARLGSGRTVPSAASREAEVSLIGRVDEIRQLAHAYRAAAGGRPQLILIHGESGIGKSALVEHAVVRAEAAGFLCLSGRCHEREKLPFLAFDRIVDRLAGFLESLDESERRALVPELVWLGRLFPVLRRGEDVTPDTGESVGEIQPEARRNRGFAAFVRVLEQMQKRGPVALAIDDLQWADRDSLGLLDFLLRHLSKQIIVVVSFRSGTGIDESVRVLVEAAVGRVSTTRIELLPLAQAEVDSLLRSVGAMSAPKRLVDEAGGNPFLVRLVGKSVTRGEASSLAGALDRQIGRLRPPAREILNISAVAGAEVTADLLRKVSGLGASEFRAALQVLVAERMVRLVPSPADEPIRVCAYHDRVRESAEQGIGDDARRDLHRRLANEIEAEGGGDVAIEELLRHWSGAGDREKRGEYLRKAAALAERRMAFERAARLWQELVGEEYAPNDGTSWHTIGNLLHLAGDLPESEAAYYRAIKEWREIGRVDGELRTLGALIEILTRSWKVEESAAAIRRGCALLGLNVWPSGSIEKVGIVRQGARLVGVTAAASFERIARQGAVRPRVRERDLRRLEFLETVARSILPIWPMRAAELWMRVHRLAIRCGKWEILGRSVAQQAGGLVSFGRPTHRRVERLLRRLDQFSSSANSHGNANLLAIQGRLTRAILRMPTTAESAGGEIASCLEELRLGGWGATFEAKRGLGIYLVCSYLCGDLDAVLAGARLARQEGSDFVLQNAALLMESLSYARRGELEKAQNASETFERLHRSHGDSMTYLPYIATAKIVTRVARGEYLEALRLNRRHLDSLMNLGLMFSDLLAGLWCQPILDAGIALARRGELSLVDELWLRYYAIHLRRIRNFGISCLGHRAFALMADARGHRERALGHLAHALATSVHAGNYHRWLCLEAGRDCNALRREQEQERMQIAHRWGYQLPQGWHEGKRPLG